MINSSAWRLDGEESSPRYKVIEGQKVTRETVEGLEKQRSKIDWNDTTFYLGNIIRYWNSFDTGTTGVTSSEFDHLHFYLACIIKNITDLNLDLK